MMRLWPFRSKQPKLQDQALAELALMFWSYPADPTPGSDLIEGARFDFTLDSLGAMDDHLEVMRGRGLEGEALMKFVLRCGAYVGEVIRRQWPVPKAWHWVDYDEAVRLDQRLVSLGKGLGTVAVLWDGKDGFCFPLAKVGKYLENGSEDSVRFFAQVMMSGPSERA